MDEIGGFRNAAWARSTVLLRANHFQFAAGHDSWVRLVGSRMVMWVISGRGTVTCRGASHELTAGEAIVLPWRSDVRYQADRIDPFLTGTAHLLPWHDPDVPIYPWPGHGAHDPLNDLRERENRHWPGFDRPRRLSPRGARQVARLGEAAVDLLDEDAGDEDARRALGLLFARVLADEDRQVEAGERLTGPIGAMCEYALSHLGERFTTADLAAVVGCSVSAAERQFRRHVGLTPTAWVRAQRLSAGARLLRTTAYRVGEVARLVGFSDPLHFSREFRRRYGMTPTQYGRRTPFI